LRVARYIVKFSGDAPPREDLERIARAPGVTVIDRTANRAMLLEASATDAAALDRQLKDWTVAEEVVYPPPRGHQLS
jgi:hypothetical protein